MIVAIIPARAGSKGLPGKNSRIVAGLPLWKWSLQAAARATTIERTIVTSDDPEILVSAQESGCLAVLRPDELATDEAPLDGALLHALDVLKVTDDTMVVVLQPTVPVRRVGLIDECVRCLEAFPNAKSLLTVTADPLHFIWTERGELLNGPRINRQQMRSHFYHEDGSVFVVSVGDFREHGTRVVPPVILYGAPRTVDIDTEEDLRIAEALLS